MGEHNVPTELVEESGFDEVPEIQYSSGFNLAEEVKEALQSAGVPCRMIAHKREINRYADDALFHYVRMTPETEAQKNSCVLVAHVIDKSLTKVNGYDEKYSIACGR